MFSKVYKNCYFILGFYASNSPFFFELANILSLKREATPDKWVSDKTEICIDGFQRSGNTFLTYYFQKFNPSTKLAHHTHSVLQIKEATQKQLPLIVTIRHPLESISSLVCYDTRLSVGVALYAYIYFYKSLLKFPNAIFFDLKENKESPWKIIQAINTHFTTNFEAPELSKKKMSQFLELMAVELPGPSVMSATIPNEIKQKEKAIIKQELIKYKHYRKAVKLYLELRKTESTINP